MPLKRGNGASSENCGRILNGTIAHSSEVSLRFFQTTSRSDPMKIQAESLSFVHGTGGPVLDLKAQF
jgi:hypothetical protein